MSAKILETQKELIAEKTKRAHIEKELLKSREAELLLKAENEAKISQLNEVLNQVQNLSLETKNEHEASLAKTKQLEALNKELEQLQAMGISREAKYLAHEKHYEQQLRESETQKLIHEDKIALLNKELQEARRTFDKEKQEYENTLEKLSNEHLLEISNLQKNAVRAAQEKQDANRQLEAVKADAAQKAILLERAYKEQIRIAEDKPSEQLDTILSQTKHVMGCYESLLQEIKKQEKIALEQNKSIEELVKSEFAKTKESLDMQANSLKRNIELASHELAIQNKNDLSVQTSHGEVIVRHIHEYPTAEKLSIYQKTQLAFNQAGELTRQVFFWVALSAIASVVLTMLLNDESLPQALMTMYETLFGTKGEI